MTSNIYRRPSGGDIAAAAGYKDPVQVCIELVDNIPYWVAVFVFALAEPFFCGFYPRGAVLVIQQLILCINTCLFLVDHIALYSNEEQRRTKENMDIAKKQAEKEVKEQEAIRRRSDESSHFDDESGNQLPSELAAAAAAVAAAAARQDEEAEAEAAAADLGPERVPYKMGHYDIFHDANWQGCFVLEVVCLLTGWVFIFYKPGIASFRCFRVFRILWFHEVECIRRMIYTSLSPYVQLESIDNAFNVLVFAINSLTALGDEMFRLTERTRGGLLLINLFIFTAYVFATVLWVETGRDFPEYCGTLGECQLIMMRMAVFDGNGFDFAQGLSKDYKFLFILVMLYICVIAFGVLNGMVGIFGTVFASASDSAFDSAESPARYNEAGVASDKEKEKEERVKRPSLSLSGEDKNKNKGTDKDKDKDKGGFNTPPRPPPPRVHGDTDTGSGTGTGVEAQTDGARSLPPAAVSAVGDVDFSFIQRIESKEFNRTSSAKSTPQAAIRGAAAGTAIAAGGFGAPAISSTPPLARNPVGGTRRDHNKSGFFLGGKQKRQLLEPPEDAVKRNMEQQRQVDVLTTKISHLERSLGHLNEMVYMLLSPEQQQQIMRTRIASLHAHQQRQQEVKRSVRGKGYIKRSEDTFQPLGAFNNTTN